MAIEVCGTTTYKKAKVEAHLSQPSARKIVRVRKWGKKLFREVEFFLV